ncbi:MAG: toll/interleukin-1 receptor domain-containing protein [Anaerolineae bacterium]|nr:toll/interleukin-1 receptor domain-containing protein [Anaerolineae bacterium]
MSWWQYCLIGILTIISINLLLRRMRLVSLRTRLSTPYDEIERELRLRAKEGLPARTPYDFFISYKSDDVMLVRPIVEQLLAEGYHIWFAEYTIPLAVQTIQDEQELDHAIVTALDKAIDLSKRGICFTNSAYYGSSWCCDEMEQLLSEKGPSNVFVIELSPEPNLLHRFPQLSYAHSRPYSTLADSLTFITSSLGHSLEPVSAVNQPDPYALLSIPYGKHTVRLNVGGWKLDSPGIEHVKGNEITIAFGYTSHEFYLHGNLYIGEMAYNRNYYRHDGEDADRIFYRTGMQFTKTFVRHLGLAARCVGVHLLYHAGSSHLAFTVDTFMKDQWTRVYSIGIPSQNRHQPDIEVHFTFRFIGTFEEYCQHVHIADALVTTLEWEIVNS